MCVLCVCVCVCVVCRYDFCTGNKSIILIVMCVCGGGWGKECIHCDSSIIGTLCSMQCKGVVDSMYMALVNACVVCITLYIKRNDGQREKYLWR